MAARFSLATLLRLREIAEGREERLLAQILSKIAEIHQTLANLEANRRALLNQRDHLLQHQTSGAELVAHCGQLTAVEDLQAKSREQLKRLEALRTQQLGVYQKVHRDKEILDQLKEEQVECFRREQLRQEQSAMDDNFSSRRLTH